MGDWRRLIFVFIETIVSPVSDHRGRVWIFGHSHTVQTGRVGDARRWIHGTCGALLEGLLVKSMPEADKTTSDPNTKPKMDPVTWVNNVITNH